MEALPTPPLEVQPQRGAIHFEPGGHEFIGEARDGFNRGNLDAHVWNTEVGERIASYAYNAPALALAIDSVGAQPPNTLYATSRQEQADAVQRWQWLPARPNKLHHSGTLFVIEGDIFAEYYPLAAMPSKQDLGITDLQKMWQETDRIENNQLQQTYNSVYGQLIGESIAIGITMLAAMEAKKELTKSVQHSQPEEAVRSKNLKDWFNQPISRRRVLKTAGKFVAGAVIMSSPLLQLIPTNEAASAPTEQQLQFWQNINRMVYPQLVDQTWANGRTALLLAKTEDVQAQRYTALQNAEYAVVMGNDHVAKVDEYQDKQVRANAIKALAEGVVKTGKQLYAQYHRISPDAVPAKAINGLLDYLSQTHIEYVTDPGGASIQPDFPKKVANHASSFMYFHSAQVEEAIRQLRPQQ